MTRSKAGLGVVAMVICTATLGVISPRNAEAQGSGAPVKVVNTPLPVSGSVDATVTGNVNATVTGNVNATVTNTVNANVTGNVNAAVTGQVSLAPGTVVNVGNSAEAPVLVRDVGAAKQMTKGFGGCFFSGFYCKIDIASVPTGYRLVIEHISGNINSFSDGISSITVGAAFLDCCIASNDDYLVPQRMPGSDRSAVNHQTSMYFAAGQTVRVFIEKTTGAGGGAANFSFTGYLIPQ